MKCFYKLVINNVNEKELHKVKNDLEYMKDTNEKLIKKSLNEVMEELNELKIKMEERELEEYVNNDEVLLIQVKRRIAFYCKRFSSILQTK